MTRPLVKETYSRNWVITFHWASLLPTSAGVMNFVRMSASVSCFLFMALLQGSHSFANANDSWRWWRIDRR